MPGLAREWSFKMGKYKEELTRAMTWLAEKEDTFFLGQSVGVKGTAMFWTLENVPMEKRLELPQMGVRNL